MPTIKLFDKVSKTAVISHVSLNHTQKQYQDVHLELFDTVSNLAEKVIEIWLKSLHVMFNVKVFATQDRWLDDRLARQTNTTYYTDPYDTNMDQN